MNPNVYEVIFNNNSKYHNNGCVFDNSGNTTNGKTYQGYYYNKYHEGLVELAKGFLRMLLNQLVDKTMVTAVKPDAKLE